MNKKKICPRCKKTKRTRCFNFNPVLKEEICAMCNRQIGTNIFYNSKPKTRKTIGKFTMTEDEKKVLAKQNGWKRVYADCKGLQTIKRRVQRNKKHKREEMKIKTETNKQKNTKFVEGLK